MDACLACRVPDPCLFNATFCSHSCRDETVHLRRLPELYKCSPPCAVTYASADLPIGGRLFWDYDRGSRAGNKAFSVDLALSNVLRQDGFNTVPCACSSGLQCPWSLWFSVLPGAPPGGGP
jgi:hypothetical protein